MSIVNVDRLNAGLRHTFNRGKTDPRSYPNRVAKAQKATAERLKALREQFNGDLTAAKAAMYAGDDKATIKMLEDALVAAGTALLMAADLRREVRKLLKDPDSVDSTKLHNLLKNSDFLERVDILDGEDD